jgi:hypothetical protein
MTEILPLLSSLNKDLIHLLKSLKASDWEKKTVCVKWTISDIASHLLDTNLRRLSLGRDGHQTIKENQIATYEELVDYLNDLNAKWVTAFGRISHPILIEMLEKYQDELIIYFEGLNPHDLALFPVIWAGQNRTENWFDMAREYTERWLHQQQIRFALNDQTLLKKTYYFPFLDTSMQALPHTYFNVKAPIGATVKVEIVGEAGGVWCIIKEKESWSLTSQEINNPTALVYIDQQIAWLLFSKGINPMDAAQYYQLHGDTDLGSHALKLKSVMA